MRSLREGRERYSMWMTCQYRISASAMWMPQELGKAWVHISSYKLMWQVFISSQKLVESQIIRLVKYESTHSAHVIIMIKVQN
jgi:hypothetical protein